MNKMYRVDGYEEIESGGRWEYILRKGSDNILGIGFGINRIKISFGEVFDYWFWFRENDLLYDGERVKDEFNG